MEKQNKYTILQSNAISRACYKCTALERQLLFYATMHTKKQNNGFYCNFSLSNFVNELNPASKKDTKKNVLTAIKRLCEQHNNIAIVNTDDSYIATVWVQKAEISIKNDNIYFYFSVDIGRYLFDLKSHFTQLDFRTITALKSFYSIRLYEIMLSYKGFKGKQLNYANQWYFSLTVDDVRQFFELSENYKSNSLTTKIIKPAITELNNINSGISIELVIIPAKNDRRKIGAYNFFCTEIDKSTYSVIQTNIQVQPTAEIQALETAIETMKSKYFNEYVQIACKNPKQPYETQLLYDTKIMKIMKKDGFNMS